MRENEIILPQSLFWKISGHPLKIQIDQDHSMLPIRSNLYYYIILKLFLRMNIYVCIYQQYNKFYFVSCVDYRCFYNFFFFFFQQISSAILFCVAYPIRSIRSIYMSVRFKSIRFLKRRITISISTTLYYQKNVFGLVAFLLKSHNARLVFHVNRTRVRPSSKYHASPERLGSHSIVQAYTKDNEPFVYVV